MEPLKYFRHKNGMMRFALEWPLTACFRDELSGDGEMGASE